ncbi:piggyBac transposable element-derived protein 3-like [Melanaphis sacchari]|uniref:piggyBac transposable element-derived protein 3-like n=1 Tax=Melanaphis sacchari TaxID=742174 RepID=UPI000DC14F7F|nr:piggyBac transposable element-derived protein 3-like [Melanaphis sacchari]
MSDKEIMKKPRGTSEECITVVDDIPITAVQWRDNKVVTMASTFVGELDKRTTKRFDKKEKKIEISRPIVIEVYNSHMGGVDLIDSMIARYRIIMRSKKWYIKIFFHLLDVTVVNSWLLYKKVTGKKCTLGAYREELAVSLCRGGINTREGRGRKSNESIEQQQEVRKIKRTKKNTLYITSTHGCYKRSFGSLASLYSK